ncbi:MAG: hypothetical protein J6P61_06720 [Erysipelotrichaceae bacterium]|nr:hypothetical protein [Erysipelotrichaceae bacterium]
MKQANVRLPVMTGDVSGVCSVLYELGGMVVMHDPSGCNSTYNTHDEIRWYDQPSLIFLSGLKHSDAIMGNDDKLINDIVTAAKMYQPNFIAICNSPIPYIIGTDFEAISLLVEQETGIPTFYVQTNAMHDYVHGASAALKKVVKMFAAHKRQSELPLVNIIGTTPLDYTNKKSIMSLKSWLTAQGYEVNANLSFDTQFDELKQLLDADVNLVVSGIGFETAKMLERDYGIPYVVGLPVKGMEEQLDICLKQAIKTKESCLAYEREDSYEDYLFIGDPVVMGSLSCRVKGRVLCPNESAVSLLTTGGQLIDGEEELIEAIGHPEVVIADPLYNYYIDENVRFIELPHFALSGRLYRKRIPDLLTFDWREEDES